MRWITLGALGFGAVAMVGAMVAAPTQDVAFAQTKRKTPPKKTPPKKAPPKQVVVPTLAPPPPLPAPPAGGNILGVGAGIYAQYANDVARVEAEKVTSVATLNEAVETLTRHPSERLAKGWVAYGALIMTHDDQFVREVRKTSAYYGRNVMLTGFRNDVRYARTIPGGAGATDLAQRVISDDAARIEAIADRFKAYSYAVQKQSWSQARVANPRADADAVRARSARPIEPGSDIILAMGAPPPRTITPTSSAEHRANFWSPYRLASAEQRLNPLSMSNPNPIVSTGGVVDRMATLAALHALDADQDNRAQMEELLNYRRSTYCFESARLNTAQCFSAGRFQYEQVFCLAEHPLREIAACMKGAAQL